MKNLNENIFYAIKFNNTNLFYSYESGACYFNFYINKNYSVMQHILKNHLNINGKIAKIVKVVKPCDYNSDIGCYGYGYDRVFIDEFNFDNKVMSKGERK